MSENWKSSTLPSSGTLISKSKSKFLKVEQEKTKLIFLRITASWTGLIPKMANVMKKFGKLRAFLSQHHADRQKNRIGFEASWYLSGGKTNIK